MGILTQTFKSVLTRGLEEGPLPITSSRIIEFLEGEPSSTGKRISPEGALKLSAVWDCVDMVSRDVARTPCPLYRKEGRNRTKAETNPLYYLLHTSPNPLMTSFSFKQALQGHKMLRGNAYASIERDEDANPIHLWPLDPAKMNPPVMSEGGTLLYVYTLPNGEQRGLTQNEVLHLRGMGNDGIMGYSPIMLMRELVALGLAYQEFSARFFGNNASPGGALLAEKRLTDEAAARLKKNWEDAHKGLTNAHRVAVLEEGIKWQQIGMALEDAQFIESSKLNRIEIASMFHIPAHKIGELDKATFTNITEQDLDYEGSALDGEFAMWEQQLNKDLLSPRQQGRLYFEFTRNALVRASIDKRYEAYQRGIFAGFLTINDVREMENKNILEGMDVPLLPVNMALGAENMPDLNRPQPPARSTREIRRTPTGYVVEDRDAEQ